MKVDKYYNSEKFNNYKIKKEMKFVSAITFLLVAVSAIKISKEPISKEPNDTTVVIPAVNAHCRQTTDQRTDPTGHQVCVASGCEKAC